MQQCAIIYELPRWYEIWPTSWSDVEGGIIQIGWTEYLKLDDMKRTTCVWSEYCQQFNTTVLICRSRRVASLLLLASYQHQLNSIIFHLSYGTLECISCGWLSSCYWQATHWWIHSMMLNRFTHTNNDRGNKIVTLSPLKTRSRFELSATVKSETTAISQRDVIAVEASDRRRS